MLTKPLCFRLSREEQSKIYKRTHPQGFQERWEKGRAGEEPKNSVKRHNIRKPKSMLIQAYKILISL
jgi:hypothetical protein